MDLVLEIWCVSMFFVSGFVTGRIKRRDSEEAVLAQGNASQDAAGAAEASNTTERDSRGSVRSGRLQRRKNTGEKRISLGWCVGSPVAGKVSAYHEGEKRGVKILPEAEMLYAPAAGKVIGLLPTGNGLRLRTDNGLELSLQVGERTEELEGRYYRPRIMLNEVVPKGKPLIEFDLQGIRGAGYDTFVTMSVEGEKEDAVTICERSWVKAGENLMWVYHRENALS